MEEFFFNLQLLQVSRILCHSGSVSSESLLKLFGKLQTQLLQLYKSQQGQAKRRKLERILQEPDLVIDIVLRELLLPVNNAGQISKNPCMKLVAALVCSSLCVDNGQMLSSQDLLLFSKEILNTIADSEPVMTNSCEMMISASESEFFLKCNIHIPASWTQDLVGTTITHMGLYSRKAQVFECSTKQVELNVDGSRTLKGYIDVRFTWPKVLAALKV